MPVEIRELVIRATVNAQQSEDTEKDWDAEGLLPAGGVDGNELIVQECVRQVLRILRKERER